MMIRLLPCLLVCLSVVSAQEPDTAVLLFAGDLTLSNNVEEFIGSRTGYVFERWKPGAEADIFMVNLEHPITLADKRVEKKFNFKMNPEYGIILKDAGITLVTAANNHVFDYGYPGIYDTMKYLDSLGIAYVGIGRNLEEARRPVILERKGVRIGFLGYFGGGGQYAARRNSPGYAPRYRNSIVEDIRLLRPKVDCVIVNFHWGTERAEVPDDWQVRLAREVVDAGADVIIGHHPHVLQGVERYKGKVIAYSLGNFVFGGNSLHTYDTAVLKILATRTEIRAEVIPVSVRQWQPVPAVGLARERVLNLVRERSLTFPDHLFAEERTP